MIGSYVKLSIAVVAATCWQSELSDKTLKNDQPFLLSFTSSDSAVFEEIIFPKPPLFLFSVNSSHVGLFIAILDTTLKGDQPRTIPLKFS